MCVTLLYDNCIPALGAAGALSKFSQSLAPMLAFALLPASSTRNAASPNLDLDQKPSVEHRVWTLLLVIPMVCVVLQVGAKRITRQICRNRVVPSM